MRRLRYGRCRIYKTSALKKYCSRWVLLKKWELLGVIKKCTKPYSTIPLIWEINLIRLAPYHWRPCVSKFRDIRKDGLHKISCRIRLFDARISRCLFCKKILQSLPFLVSQNFGTQGRQWYGAKWIIFIFANKGNGGTRFGAPLYYLK